MRKLWWLDGWQGHDDYALARLAEFVDDLKETEPAQLIVTGDNTAWGKDSEFGLADAFLATQLPSPPFPSTLGLSESDWKDRAIPGNHDHWGGYPVIGGPSSSLATHFPWLPFFIAPLVPLGSKHQLRFIGLNSDAEVGPLGPARVFALGKFKNAADALITSLPPVHPNEIRILLLHHSPESHGPFNYIRPQSRLRLFDLLRNHKIHILLTGHLHKQFLGLATVSTAHPMGAVLEARCGTTTQVQSAKLRIPGLTSSKHVHSLLIHRLDFDGAGNIVWQSELNILNSSGGFFFPGNPYKGLQTKASVVVWPHQW
jgi:hypothetical protein